MLKNYHHHVEVKRKRLHYKFLSAKAHCGNNQKILRTHTYIHTYYKEKSFFVFIIIFKLNEKKYKKKKIRCHLNDRK